MVTVAMTSYRWAGVKPQWEPIGRRVMVRRRVAILGR